MAISVCFLQCYIKDCTKTCVNKKLLRSHIKKDHGLRRYLCHSVYPVKCGKSYDKLQDLKKHAGDSHGHHWPCPYPDRVSPEKMCPKKACRSQGKLHRHFMEMHYVGKFYCAHPQCTIFHSRRQDARICKNSAELTPIPETDTVAWFDLLPGVDPLKLSRNSVLVEPLVPTSSASLGGVNHYGPNLENMSDWPDYLPECDPRNHSFLGGKVFNYKQGLDNVNSNYSQFDPLFLKGTTSKFESNPKQQQKPVLGQYRFGVSQNLEGAFNSNNSALAEPLVPTSSASVGGANHNGKKHSTATLEAKEPTFDPLPAFNLPEPAVFNSLSAESRAKVLGSLPVSVKNKYKYHCWSYELNQLIKACPINIGQFENGTPQFKAAIEGQSNDLDSGCGTETLSFFGKNGNIFANGKPNSASKSSVLTQDLGKGSHLSSVTSMVALVDKSSQSPEDIAGKSKIEILPEASLQLNMSAFSDAINNSSSFSLPGNSEHKVSNSIITTSAKESSGQSTKTEVKHSN